MDWDDPIARYNLIEKVGPDAYNEAIRKHFRENVIDVVDGHEIRSVSAPPFGTLFSVGSTNKAFRKLDEARTFAAENPLEGIHRVTETDVYKAAGDGTVDGALAQLMAIAGITSGDIAGHCFSDIDDQKWGEMALHERVAALQNWKNTEKSFDAEGACGPKL